MFIRNSQLTPNSQTLRINMTPQEKHLWYDFLKNLPLTARRQHNIDNFIVDFYIPRAKLVIELDGSQHYDGKVSETDKVRDEELKKLGITVKRYSNRDVDDNFEGVCADVLNILGMCWDDMG